MASSSSADVSKYQVFVNFRGEDTRYNFTSHLLNGLKDRGIHFFFDDRRVEIGDQLSSALLGAIDESKISVIVFSKNYANSSCCLEEVSHIMDCWHSRQQLVVPIFYHVDPSHVRNQTGSFEEAFVEHVRRGTETNKIQRWRDALKEAGNLSGWHLAGDKPEPIVIEAIVEDILSKLNLISKRDYEGQGLVGVRPKLEQIKSLLNRYYEEDVGMIGIWGMGGIGKTTLAQAIFNEVLGEFESGHFVANVREELEKRGAITLRKEMLSTLLNEENLRANSIYLQVTKDRLRSKRVVIVLDDVDDFRKLEELQIYKNNFGSGSRIIVTSRDKQVLQDAKVDAIYEVKELNDPEDLQLFCLHAFGQQNHLVDYDFRDLSAKLLKYVKGLPIALKVLGKALEKKDGDYWTCKLKTLEQHPPKGIFDELKISFEALESTVEENIFLDIACFGYDADQLESCYGDMADCALSNLVDKCLLTTKDYNSYKMHHLLREMGQKIVRQESDNPGKRTRLWKLQEDVCRVLKHNLDKSIWCFLVMNLILEILSLVFDQLTSKYRPQFALIALLISVIALTICIMELIWKGASGKYRLRLRGIMPWFYCYQTEKPFVTLWDFVGYTCAVSDICFKTINYSFISQHRICCHVQSL